MASLVRYLRNLLFSKPAISERHYNLENNLDFAKSLAFRFDLAQLPYKSDVHNEWLLGCMSETVRDVMRWMYREIEIDALFDYETGIAFPLTGVVVLLINDPDEEYINRTLPMCSAFYGSAITAYAAVRFRTHLLARIDSYPGTVDEFDELFGTDNPQYQVAGRWFELDSDDAVVDAYEYLEMVHYKHIAEVEYQKEQAQGDQTDEDENGDQTTSSDDSDDTDSDEPEIKWTIIKRLTAYDFEVDDRLVIGTTTNLFAAIEECTMPLELVPDSDSVSPAEMEVSLNKNVDDAD